MKKIKGQDGTRSHLMRNIIKEAVLEFWDVDAISNTLGHTSDETLNVMTDLMIEFMRDYKNDKAAGVSQDYTGAGIVLELIKKKIQRN